MNAWTITLFGGLRAQQGEQVVTRFRTQKVASLFAYLAYHVRQAHSREILIEMLWPESDAPTLRNSLSVALSSLRHQFEPPGVPQGTVLRADRFSIGLNPATVTTDVARFEKALRAAAGSGSNTERAQHFSEALEWYQGPLLPGFYDEWIVGEQERLVGLYLDASAALVGYLEESGDRTQALSYGRNVVAMVPLREEGQQQLIRLLNASGQPGAALRQYREYERLLDEIGDEPSAALRSLYRRIEKESGLTWSPEATTPVSRAADHRNLPALADPHPGGATTVTFLLTDIEEGVRLLQQEPEAWAQARARRHALLRHEFARHGGQEVTETGDGFVVAFTSARRALGGAVAAQQALAREARSPENGALKVRMALHTGDVESGSVAHHQDYGPVLNHARRMLTAAHGGQIIASDTTATLGQAFAREDEIRFVDLGVWRLRDVSEAKRLFQVEYPGMAQTQFGPLAAESGHSANLPTRFTRFFGREKERAALRRLLIPTDSPQARLVVVTGPGGNGKTRLAIEVAQELVESFAGAVYFAALADLSDPTLIAGILLDSLGADRAPLQEPLEQAIDLLRRRPTLLVLDNFEHLVEGGADVLQSLLTRVPSLTLLVTSRQVLGLSAEREFALSPLPTPAGEEGPEQLSLYDSVQLFIDRAQQVIPYFQVTNANAAALAALIAGLEGIPLAIELAAARVQALTPSQMLAQLDNRLTFLTSRKRDVTERQRTLRGALEWSYRLLTPELQRFFSRLSVFRGGWSVEAAEAICEEPLALDYLEQLRDCSLVLPSSADPDAAAVRFRMLETMREYGQERLTERNETDFIHGRHLEWCLALAEQGARQMGGPEQIVWLDRLETEHDNLRSALDWSATSAAANPQRTLESGHRIATALGWFWTTRGHRQEAALRLQQALADPALARTGRAAALYWLGILANQQSDYATARARLAESIALRREMLDRRGVALSLFGLGNVAMNEGDYASANALIEECLGVFQEIGDRWGKTAALSNLGNLSIFQGDLALGRTRLEEALALRREVGDRHGIAISLHNLGALSLGEARQQGGDLAPAQALLEEALAAFREVGDRRLAAGSLFFLGQVARARGDFVSARALYEESLTLRQVLGDRQGIAFSLEGMAETAVAGGAFLRAARLWGAAAQLREEIRAPRTPSRHRSVEADVAAARASPGVDAAAFAAAEREGRAMTVEQAVDYALGPSL